METFPVAGYLKTAKCLRFVLDQLAANLFSLATVVCYCEEMAV